MTTQSTPHALTQELSTRLMAGATATETLLAWCEEHGLSQGPITVEVRQRLTPAVIPDDVRAALGPAAGETVHYRQVRLMRGTLPLATAENWFVPQRLAAGMTEVLQMTDVPFGTVVAPLRPSRRTLVARAQPLTADPSEDPSRLSASARPSQPNIILKHTAVILSGTGTALALVQERFSSELVSSATAKPPLSRVLDGRSRAGSATQPMRLER
jgi:chorismate-pyruvate lyase